MADIVKDINKIVFVSDVEINSDREVFDNISKITSITSYSSLFINRNMEDLNAKNIHKIWININNPDAMNWLKLNVLSKKDRDYNVFCVYRQAGGINQKWISSCKADVVVEYEKIAKISALNFQDFFDNMIAQGIDIAKPLVHKWLSCLYSDRVSKN